MGKKCHNVTAVIYDKRSRILSVGRNDYDKSHPVQARYARLANQPEKIYLHAEIAAIVRCRRIRSAHRIFISRGNSQLAKPCPICQIAIREAGINIVEYTG